MKGIRKRLKGAFKIEYANALVGRQAAINRGNVGSSLTQGVRESQKTSMFADFYVTCELKVCSTKKPWNPTAPPALPAVPELSALCVIRAPALKGGKNVSENNA